MLLLGHQVDLTQLSLRVRQAWRLLALEVLELLHKLVELFVAGEMRILMEPWWFFIIPF